MSQIFFLLSFMLSTKLKCRRNAQTQMFTSRRWYALGYNIRIYTYIIHHTPYLPDQAHLLLTSGPFYTDSCMFPIFDRPLYLQGEPCLARTDSMPADS